MVELIFCTYIWTEQVGKLITVSLKLDEFSWGKDQILLIVNNYSEFQVKVFSNNRDIRKF